MRARQLSMKGYLVPSGVRLLNSCEVSLSVVPASFAAGMKRPPPPAKEVTVCPKNNSIKEKNDAKDSQSFRASAGTLRSSLCRRHSYGASASAAAVEHDGRRNRDGWRDSDRNSGRLHRDVVERTRNRARKRAR